MCKTRFQIPNSLADNQCNHPHGVQIWYMGISFAGNTGGGENSLRRFFIGFRSHARSPRYSHIVPLFLGDRSAASGDIVPCMSQMNLSARAYHRTRSVKLARTIADLAGSEDIQSAHLAEALQYRPKIMMG